MIRGPCGPIPLIVLAGISLLTLLAITNGYTLGIGLGTNGGSNPGATLPGGTQFPYSQPQSSPPQACASAPVIKTQYWMDRDPYKDPYYLRPLEDVMIEMSDYPPGGRKADDYKHQQLMTKFAWEVIERDRLNPEVLRYPMKLNQTILDMLPDRQPYFTYWNQGPYNTTYGVVQEMAYITRAKVKRMEEEFPDWAKFELVQLDDSIINNYVSFPKHVLENKGTHFSTTYYSDLLRLNLLCEYGGFWADSSFFWDKPMPRSVYDSEYFAFKIWHTPAYSSSWFLHAKPHNPVWLWTRHIMFEYWHTHDFHRYFDFHLVMEIVLQMLPEIRPYYDTMPFYSSIRAHSLHNIMGGSYNESKYESARTRSWGFKLSNKARTIAFKQKLTERANEAKEYLGLLP